MSTSLRASTARRVRMASAAVIAAPRSIALIDTPVDSPGRGEMLVRVEGCGLCASNLPPWEGRPWFKYPFAPGEPGHESWGVIEAVGDDVRDFRPGDRVATLSTCAYARYTVCSADQVVALPEGLDGQPFPGEPLGCAFNVFKRSLIGQEHTVAIIGIGFLGAVLTRLASAAGARVIAVSRRPFALEVARRMGAAHVLALSEPVDIPACVRELTGGALCDRVIEAVGEQRPLDIAGELTRERGRLIVAGYHQDGLRHVNMQLWNWRGLDVVNAHERDPRIYQRGIREAADAVASKRLDISELYTHRFALGELGTAFDCAARRPDGFMKALIMM